MGILNGGIAKTMGRVMGTFYLPATLWTVGLVEDGQGGGSEARTPQQVKVQENMIREEVRAAMGVAQTAKQFLILQDGVTGGLNDDSELEVGGVTYALSQPQQDPAKSYWKVIGVPK